MNKGEFLAQIQTIGAAEDVETMRASLSELSNSVSADYDNFATTEQQKAALEENNETLRKANMKLFLQVGDASEDEKHDENEELKDKPETKLKFEDLLDEKGGLK